MKTVVKKAVKDQKGAALALALVLLVVGGLILTPLLGLMSTGLISGQVYEKKTAELYAADAGVEDAIWRIQANNLTFNHASNSSGPWHVTVNGKNVTVEVYREDLDLTPCVDDYTYQILSTAATQDPGNTAAIDSATTIDAHITTTVTYSSILDYLVAIHDNLEPKDVAALEEDLDNLHIPCPTNCAECDKCAKAYNYDSQAYRDIPEGCWGCIAVYNFPDAGWPKVSELSARYLKDVENALNYMDTTVDLNGNSCPPGPIYINDEQNDNWPLGLGPLHVDGELTLQNGDQNCASLTLNGTLYVTGHTEIGMHGTGGKPNLLIELNNQTIFVSCNYTKADDYALKIGPWCTINGPGVIVAVGDIYFQPNGAIGPNEEPALVLSVSGTTTIQPGVDFLGTVAGKLDVNLGAGSPSVRYPIGGFGPVNFPAGFEAGRTYAIASWEINPP